MKRVLALAIALLMLLASAACAEAPSTIITVDRLAMQYTADGDVRDVALSGSQLELMMGLSGERPSLQMIFSSESGQQLGAIIQIIDGKAMLSMGSVSSVFYYDLSRLSDDSRFMDMIRLAVTSAGTLGGTPLIGLLTMMTEEGEGGVRVARGTMQAGGFLAAVDDALGKAEGLDAADQVDFAAMREQIETLGDTVQTEFSYDLQTGAFSARLFQEGWSVALTGFATLRSEPFVYADVDPEDGLVDVMNMSQADIDDLNDELSMMAGRVFNFAAIIGFVQDPSRD